MGLEAGLKVLEAGILGAHELDSCPTNLFGQEKWASICTHLEGRCDPREEEVC